MKKSLFFILIVALILAATTFHCEGQNFIKPSKKYIQKGLDGPDEFDKVVVACDVDVEYSQNFDGFAIAKAYGSNNVVEALDMTIEDRTMTISFKDDVKVRRNKGYKLLVTLSAPSLIDVSLEDGGTFKIIGTLNRPSDDLSLKVSGGGEILSNSLRSSTIAIVVEGDGAVEIENIACRNIEGKLDGSGVISAQRVVCNGDIDMDLLGDGDIALSGYVHQADYNINGSGKIKAELLRASSVVINISGTGSIKCRATETLQVEGDGGGKVEYMGSPVVTVNAAMKRNVKRIVD